MLKLKSIPWRQRPSSECMPPRDRPHHMLGHQPAASDPYTDQAPLSCHVRSWDGDGIRRKNTLLRDVSLNDISRFPKPLTGLRHVLSRDLLLLILTSYLQRVSWKTLLGTLILHGPLNVRRGVLRHILFGSKPYSLLLLYGLPSLPLNKYLPSGHCKNKRKIHKLNIWDT